MLNHIGHVSTTYCSAHGSRAHSTPEYVAIAELLRAARAYALAAPRSAGVAE